MSDIIKCATCDCDIALSEDERWLDTRASPFCGTGYADNARHRPRPLRKWQMIRLGAGDYLLPSNDRQTMWRLFRYEEDGSLISIGPDGVEVPIRGHYWMVCRWNAPLTALADGDWDEWDRWQEYESLLPSRSAAIDSALSRELAPR